VRITWSASAGATHYEVYRASAPDGTKTKLASPTGTGYDDASTVEGATYHYWLRACNSAGCSDYSAIATIHRGGASSRPPLEEIKGKVDEARGLLEQATELLDEALALLETL
jgi:fibronectin type 3 domain-containing protein